MAIARRSASSAMREAVRKPLPGGLWVPCVTPRMASGALDLGALRSLVTYALDGGAAGLVFGDAPFLEDDEHAGLGAASLLEAGVAECAGRAQVFAGVRAAGPAQAEQAIDEAAKCGCTGVLLELESDTAYLNLESPLPLVLMLEPDIPAERLRDMARKLGGALSGVLDPDADASRLAELRETLSKSVRVYGGAVERSGTADGCFDVLANAFPREAAEALGGVAEKQAYLEKIRARVESSRNGSALLQKILCALGLPLADPRTEPGKAEWLATKAAVAKGGRLVAGEAGREVPRTAIGAKPVHLVDSRTVEQARDTAPVPSEAVSLWRVAGPPLQYGCHPFITHHEGRFFAMWSGGAVNEDSPGQLIRFATSTDGRNWSAPQPAVPAPRGMGRWTPGGFWVRDGRLLLLAIHYTRARYVEGEQTPGTCWEDLAAQAFVWDGVSWQGAGPVLDDIYVNEPPRRLPGGGWMMTGVNGRHDALVAIGGEARMDDWTVQVLAPRTEGYKLTEPSWFVAKDGRIRVLLRDDGGSRRLWLCESRDGGETWAAPALTDFPDAQAKFFALSLPDCTVALCGNPDGGTLRRRMLAVSLSRDGMVFERCVQVALDETSVPRLKGMHKAPGFHYPNACVVNGRLWIVHSIHKEDIEVRSIALAELRM
ncbi:MAG: exo-alpha-sialidase [Planctomycetes bacterium]|nr:exo-alpha-sialidase [Planctomycetota bacterium]